MPICTKCTTGAPYVYTTYESEHNLRLEECRNCKTNVDPFVEADHLTLFIDLILLKRGVSRHLLFNRGSEPRRLGGELKKPLKPVQVARERRLKRWWLLLKLGTGLILLDAYIRWCYLDPNPSSEPIIWTAPVVKRFLLILVGTATEVLAFHIGISFLTFIALKLLDGYRLWRYGNAELSDTRKEFTLSLVPLSLFYSSLTKYFLLFLLTIWPPAKSSPSDQQSTPTWPQIYFPDSAMIHQVFHTLDDRNLDKDWVVRNIMGGMSAGFGLRIVLDDLHPFFTTLVILLGWGIKATVSNAVSDKIGLATQTAWRAYSIP
ncbi:hypothetical protein FA15DRAFT_685719 [Coprinopsis marcescibilis]|uniref:Protein ARV n=1 Tax=Coprinopsis marcescibilis TaxID=230819 RepID=A0A5C3L518_COPMA|nr:hypothetical protein FA15DRAFT_685719 [Coprinopsis marcescibilis]